MHLFLVPLLALQTLAPLAVAEPTEDAMRIAFEQRVTTAVAGALEFVAETGGDAAVDAIQTARTDRFDVLGFKKDACETTEGAAGYHCTFDVGIATVAGEFHQTLRGWFYPAGDGLAFADET